MPTLRITLSYDGTGFVGWQRQANGTSIQGLLEEALARIDGAPVTVTGAGRTDAGVHALGQVASAGITRAIEIADLIRALNAILPPPVRVLTIREEADGFSARFSARSKTYRYRIVNAETLSPFERQYAWHVRQALDIAAMSDAACTLEGRHDFAAFQASGGSVTTSVRTILRSSLRSREDVDTMALIGGRLILYDVAASGFLRHMVRNIVGTLVDVGLGHLPAAAVESILLSRDRSRAGPTAPAHGLFLVDVDYDGAADRDCGDE